MAIFNSKRRISIATRLYFVVGLMGLLILLELLTLRFAMQKLSAVRAFVGGESLWGKAQKNAVFSLQRFATTKSEKDYQQFLDFLSVPLGDHQARLSLEKNPPDREGARVGFLRGGIHPDDIDPIVDLLLKFYWVEDLEKAIQVWKAADLRLEELISAGAEFHSAVLRGQARTANQIMDHIKYLNDELQVLEEDFSRTLGEGSRFLETVVLTLLTIAVVTVESIGLGLAVLTARSISRGLTDLNRAAHAIGHGQLATRVAPRGNDEITELAAGLNLMGEMLQKSYGELEARVQERTVELAKLAGENARLYNDASQALRRRDEFLSLASHELKTPITSLLLQSQMLLRNAANPLTTPGPASSPEQLKKLASFLERQLLRINDLVEEMLDTSRIDLSKLTMRFEDQNLSDLVREICHRLEPQLSSAGLSLQLEVDDGLVASFDGYRIEQVLTNLLTNAMKYAPGAPVKVELHRRGEKNELLELAVHDRGPGIAPEDAERIFGRFERGVAPGRVSGLGIGLFIARAIVVAHQGRLYVDPAAPAGARFVVELPVTRPYTVSG